MSSGFPIILGPSLWTPKLLSTAVWLDADDPSTIILNGTTVSQWNDKSGNNKNVSQATAANQPTYLQNGFNGRGTFDWGTAANSKQLSFVTGSATENWREVISVAVYDLAGSTWGTNNVGLVTDAVGSVMGFQGPAGSGSWNTTNWFTNNLFTNGSKTASNVAFPAVRSPFMIRGQANANVGVNGLSIGTDRNFGTRGWRGRISEVVISSAALTELQRNQLEGYLAWKWGLVSVLDSAHPYKNSPPYA